MLDIFNDLPDQFDRQVAGRILLLDGDGPCYEAASTVKTLPTALRRYQTLVETGRFMAEAESVRVHLTPRGCKKCRRDEYPTVKPYQGNRVGKPKPPLLEPLRSAVGTHSWDEHWDVLSWYDREADDGLMQDALYYGDRAVMMSADKDLNITPGPLWIADLGIIDTIPDRFGWINLKELTSSVKVSGHGTKFFWAQMLMGDAADNVQGITRLHGKLCGPVAAFNALKGTTSEYDAAEFIVGAYIEAKQNVLAEAECLWLRRSTDDSAYLYLKELGLPDYMQHWLDNLNQYHQEVLAYNTAMRDAEYGEPQEQSCSSTGSETQRSDCDVPWAGGCSTGCRGCSDGAV